MRVRQTHVQLNRMPGSCAIVGKGAGHGEISAFSIDGDLGKTSHRWPCAKYARKINGFYQRMEGKDFLGRGTTMKQLRELESMWRIQGGQHVIPHS